MSGIKHKGSITFSGAFPETPYAGQMGVAPKYPLVASLPATVVDGQRWRLESDGLEYLGVGGVWVAQPSVTQAVWMWDGSLWYQPQITFTDEFPEYPYTGQSGTVGGVVWVWDGSNWDILSISGYEGETILIDEFGNILVDENYNVLIEV
jgi:hypothetical protein